MSIKHLYFNIFNIEKIFPWKPVAPLVSFICVNYTINKISKVESLGVTLDSSFFPLTPLISVLCGLFLQSIWGLFLLLSISFASTQVDIILTWVFSNKHLTGLCPTLMTLQHSLQSSQDDLLQIKSYYLHALSLTLKRSNGFQSQLK